MQNAYQSARALNTEISAEDPIGKKANHSARVSFLSENPSSGSDNPKTTIGRHQRQTFNTTFKKSLLTERSLNIDELKKLHESQSISTFIEPTNEQRPYRPKVTKPLTREQLRMRIHMAVESCRLSNDVRPETNEMIEDDNEEFQFQIAGNDADFNDNNDIEEEK